MKKLFVALAGLSIAAAAIPASAIDLRHANQERRIDAGRRSGKLTYKESAYLKTQGNEINALETQLKARHGGHLSKADQRLLKSKHDQLNREILRMKSNRARGKNHLKI